ncbi:hypothetical protein [Amycolatopsis lurida]|uniref:hypothetical protein n=1 Tax=Amycolatopsis lurida TaxID=31959 RepID=UPI00115FE7DC|nr:hypothetical protein [Amycolatopsis lurida]
MSPENTIHFARYEKGFRGFAVDDSEETRRFRPLVPLRTDAPERVSRVTRRRDAAADRIDQENSDWTHPNGDSGQD